MRIHVLDVPSIDPNYFYRVYRKARLVSKVHRAELPRIVHPLPFRPRNCLSPRSSHGLPETLSIFALPSSRLLRTSTETSQQHN